MKPEQAQAPPCIPEFSIKHSEKGNLNHTLFLTRLLVKSAGEMPTRLPPSPTCETDAKRKGHYANPREVMYKMGTEHLGYSSGSFVHGLRQ